MPRDHLADHLQDLALRDCSTRTIERHARVLAHWQSYLAQQHDRELLDATPADVLAYLDHRVAAGLKDLTVRAELCILRTFYHRLAELGALAPEPTAALPTLICRPSAEKKVLTVDECFRLLEAAGSRSKLQLRSYVIVALLWSTGLRSSELRELRWKDLDLDQATLLVRRGKGRTQRQLFLNERLLDDLLALQRELGGAPDDPVFYALNGRGRDGARRTLTASQLIEIVRQLAVDAGIDKPVTPLTLRHTFATHMYEAGATIAEIKELLGHTDETESTVYVHVSLEMARAMLQQHVASPADRRP